jgi:hypothetical protein
MDDAARQYGVRSGPRGRIPRRADGGAAFLTGLLSLAGRLLLRAAKAEGVSGDATQEEMRAVLQDIARRTLS